MLGHRGRVPHLATPPSIPFSPPGRFALHCAIDGQRAGVHPFNHHRDSSSNGSRFISQTDEAFAQAWLQLDDDNSGEVGLPEFETWFLGAQDEDTSVPLPEKNADGKLVQYRRGSVTVALAAIGGYRALLNSELRDQVRAMSTPPPARTEDDLETLLELRNKLRFLGAHRNLDDLRNVARYLQVEVVQPDATIVKHGDVGNKIYMVLAGSVTCSWRILPEQRSDESEPTQKAADDEDESAHVRHVHEQIYAGGHFGAMTVVLGSGARESTTAVAREETASCPAPVESGTQRAGVISRNDCQQ